MSCLLLGDHTVSYIAPTLSPMLLHATVICVPLEMVTIFLYMANVSYIYLVFYHMTYNALPTPPSHNCTICSTLAGPIRVILFGYGVSSVHHM
jgi:hypothetical protein